MVPGQHGGRDGHPVGIEGTGDRGELPGPHQALFGRGQQGRVVPHRGGQTEHHTGGIGLGRGVVGSEDGLAPTGVRRRRRRGVVEAGGRIGQHRDGQSPKITSPMTRVSTGRPTTFPAMRPQAPPWWAPTRGIRGQNTLRPSTANRAGSRVRLASRATAIPMASAGPSPW